MAGLTRPKYPMPDFLREALLHRGLMEIYPVAQRIPFIVFQHDELFSEKFCNNL